MRYNNGADWYTVNGSPGLFGYQTYEYMIIGATTADTLQVAPGDVSEIGTMDFGACEAASAGKFVDLDFAGGKLGIWNNDFEPDDNVDGEGGVDPTWQLTALDPCP